MSNAKVECHICGQEMTLGRLPRHINVRHGGISKYDFYFRYVALEDEARDCVYCQKPRKPARYTRMYDTCGSKNCKTMFSRKGCDTQITEDIGMHSEQGRVDSVQKKLANGVYTNAGIRMNATLNKIKSECGFRSEAEKIFWECASKSIPELVSDDHRFHHSKGRTEECGLNIIMDFTIPSRRINIEIDGSWHTGKEELDSIRDSKLSDKGWTVIRFTNEQVKSDVAACVEELRAALV